MSVTLTPERITEIRKLLAAGKIPHARRRLARWGYVIVRGAYINTPDDRLDSWYVEDDSPGPVDRRGPGSATIADAIDNLLTGWAMTTP